MVETFQNHFDQLCDLISNRTGLRMNAQARSRLLDVLPRRIARGDYRSDAEYYHFLRDDPAACGEYADLAAQLTTCKSALMHRDICNVLQQLANESNSSAAGGLSILTVGSTAHTDALTAGIVLTQAGIDIHSDGVVIAALDFNLERLARAADGIHTERALAALPPHIQQEFFDPVELHRYQARPRLRDAIHWNYADLLQGWQPAISSRKWDAILCRRFFVHLNGAALERWRQIISLLAPDKFLLAERLLNSSAGMITSQSGRLWLHRKALQLVDDSISIDEKRVQGLWMSDYATACVAAALQCLREKQPERAHAHAATALSLTPCSPEALLTCGVASERSGNLRSAEQFYRKALLVKPAMAVAHLHLAELHRNAGRPDEARKIYRNMPHMHRSPGVRIPVQSVQHQMVSI